MSDKPRAYTKEEAQRAILEQIAHTVDYWEKESRRPDARGKLTGLAFSILAMIDGSNIGIPAIDLVLRPHPDDEQYHKDEGENWWEDGMAINDEVHLHEMWHQVYREVTGNDD